MEAEFPSFFKDQRKRVEQSVERLLPPADANPLAEAMRYSTLGGGKRIRGVLVLETARLGDDPDKSLVRTLSGIIELLHTYTLVHDDLPAMDDDDMRRGKPACHKKYDEATAVLSGNALLTRSFEVLGEVDTEDETRISLLRCTGAVMGWSGILEGQRMDLDLEGTVSTEDQIQEMYEKKTGYLLGLALEYGAIAGRLDEETCAQFREIGRTLGLAFQVRDDLLEREGNPDQIGKDGESDRNRAKSTLLEHLGMDEARKQAERFVRKGRTLLNELDYNTTHLEEMADFLFNRSY